MSDTLQSDGIDRNHSNDETMAFHLFQFPTAEALSLATESDLRSLGMGYRAKFLVESSKIAAGKPDGAAAWFAYLRSLSKAEVVQSAVPTDNIKKEQEVEEASPKRRRKKPVLILMFVYKYTWNIFFIQSRYRYINTCIPLHTT